MEGKVDKNNDIFSLSSYDFKIDENRIRKYPRANREDAKLLVVDKSGNIKFDGIFKDIANFLNENSILVLNNTRVIKSRILAKRLKTNKEIEILIIEKINSSSFLGLVKNQKSFKISEKLEVLNIQRNFQVANESYPMEGYGEDKQQSLVLKVVDKNEEGIVVDFGFDASLDLVDSLGKIPIPPYLRRESEKIDEIYYQTVYSSKKGSVAAPTAGLHFTDLLLNQIEQNGTKLCYLTLHVGWGTFKPVRTEDIREHKIHKEYYSIPENTAEALNKAKIEGKKIIACGTTTLRALEGCFQKNQAIMASEGETSIYIYPGFRFNVVDGLVTNFHTPKSSLLMLVSAFAGYENIKKYYEYAINNDFSFFSYGDSMFIFP